MWNYHGRILCCCIVMVCTVTLSRQSELETAKTQIETGQTEQKTSPTEETLLTDQKVSLTKETFPTGENPVPTKKETQVTDEKTPLTEEDTPLTEEETPLTEEETPRTDKETPLTDKETPLTEEETPRTDKETPLTEEETPLTEEETPLTEEEALLTEEETPLTEEEALLTEEETSLTEDEASETEDETPETEDETSEAEEEILLDEGEVLVAEGETPEAAGIPEIYNIPVTPTTTNNFDESQFVTYSVALASSPPLLRNLAENEEIIYILIKTFYTRYSHHDAHLRPPTEKPFKLMHSYLLNFETTTGQLNLTLERQKEDTHYRAFKAVWNPLTTYFMFQRFNKPLKEIVRSLNTTKPEEFALQKQIFNVMRSTGWPVPQDLSAATSAIIRVQHVYDLNTFQISNGNLAGFETNVNLSPVDCVEIAKQAQSEKHHALAVEWYEIALWKFKFAPGIPTAEISGSTYLQALEHYIKHSHESHDFHYNISETWDAMFFTSLLQNQEIPTRYRRRTTELNKWKGGSTANLALLNYWGTCSGANYKSEREKSKLFCWYETEANYAYKINPLKAELLSSEPLVVVQYYDMIGNRMIAQIKQDTQNRLAHSVVYGDGNSLVISPIRTSLNSWIDDNTRSDFFSVPEKIEAATGLKVKSPSSSEFLQVAAYTSGSHYSVHLDAFSNKDEEDTSGDRIATFIYYISDVEKGGGTSFPQSGIASEPVKGSAVLWYNLKRNGDVDDYTWHGACPVIVGEKWICNKWIRSNDQMFLSDYKCTPNQEDRFHLRINGKNLMDIIKKEDKK